MHIHAQKLRFWGGCDHLNGRYFNRNPERNIIVWKDVIRRTDRQNRSTGATCARDEEIKKTNENTLREHKPLPDFGLPDPKRDPDRHQNCITWSLGHALSLQKISSTSVHKFASNPTDRQTNRQTDRTKNITPFFGGGNKETLLW